MSINVEVDKKKVEKLKGKKIYEKFYLGIKQIISELELENPKVEIRTYETEKIGVDYISEIKTDKIHIYFHIRTKTKGNDLNKFDRTLISIDIGDGSRPHPYSSWKWFENEFPLSKFISNFFHKKNVKMQNKLSYLIENHIIKFVGDWGISTPSATLFEVFIDGSMKNNYFRSEKINVLRIRHIDEGSRAYSYIILLDGSAYIFPDFCGPDSGEGGAAYDKVERIIDIGIKNKRMIVYDLDVDYDKFKEFSAKHMSIDTFNSSIAAHEYDKYITTFKKHLDKNIFMETRTNNKNEQVDALTGLFEKNKLKEIDFTNYKKVSIAFIDIDNFKKINDNYGYDKGDMTLKEVASILKNFKKRGHLVLRAHGSHGDEFIVVFLDLRKEEVYKLLENHRKKIEENDIENFKITVSIGIASYPEDGKNNEEIIKKADDALHFSKKNGGNCTTVYSEEIKEEVEVIQIRFEGIADIKNNSKILIKSWKCHNPPNLSNLEAIEMNNLDDNIPYTSRNKGTLMTIQTIEKDISGVVTEVKRPPEQTLFKLEVPKKQLKGIQINLEDFFHPFVR